MKKTLKVGKEFFQKNLKKGCFELLGFDFMVDVNGNVWLIEVNTNPCLEESNFFLSQLIPRVVGKLTRRYVQTDN